MGLLDFLRRLVSGGEAPVQTRWDLAELARRLDLTIEQIEAVPVRYQSFTLPKRSGGTRRIQAPEAGLKDLQRRVLRRVLGRLRSHPCCMGFEKGRSIVHNARPHVGKAVVLRMDVKDFFPSTSARRVEAYFRRIGWDRPAAKLLTGLCTHEGGLPQGAPTSPRLSNLVNFRLDARLAGMATRLGASYTRYADDITFSVAEDVRDAIAGAIASTKVILADLGYRLHQDKKLRISRRHNRQVVTGLVVNDGVNLPRKTRRWLRAVRHHLDTGRTATLTEDQLAGWEALEDMVAEQG